MKKILQYSLAGKLLCTHKGLRKAALAAGANRTTIMKACQAAEKLLPKAGYFWRYANKPFTEEELTEIRRLWEKTDRSHLKDKRTTEVLQYSLSGELIGKYISITAAAEAVGVSQPALSAAARPGDKLKKCKGYFWRHKDTPFTEEELEAIRHVHSDHPPQPGRSELPH